MELTEGSTLADRIKQGPIPIDETLRIAKKMKDDQLLLKSSEGLLRTSWSHDGRFLMYTDLEVSTNPKAVLWVLPLEGDKKPVPFLPTQFNEQDGRFSPEGIGSSVRRTNRAATRYMFERSLPTLTGRLLRLGAGC